MTGTVDEVGGALDDDATGTLVDVVAEGAADDLGMVAGPLLFKGALKAFAAWPEAVAAGLGLLVVA